MKLGCFRCPTPRNPFPAMGRALARIFCCCCRGEPSLTRQNSSASSGSGSDGLPTGTQLQGTSGYRGATALTGGTPPGSVNEHPGSVHTNPGNPGDEPAYEAIDEPPPSTQVSDDKKKKDKHKHKGGKSGEPKPVKIRPNPYAGYGESASNVTPPTDDTPPMDELGHIPDPPKEAAPVLYPEGHTPPWMRKNEAIDEPPPSTQVSDGKKKKDKTKHGTDAEGGKKKDKHKHKHKGGKAGEPKPVKIRPNPYAGYGESASNVTPPADETPPVDESGHIPDPPKGAAPVPYPEGNTPPWMGKDEAATGGWSDKEWDDDGSSTGGDDNPYNVLDNSFGWLGGYDTDGESTGRRNSSASGSGGNGGSNAYENLGYQHHEETPPPPPPPPPKPPKPRGNPPPVAPKPKFFRPSGASGGESNA